jgi:hypothetical protein
MLEQADSHGGAGRPSSDRDDHTVVIGGSVAGLLAARVLVDHFEQVRLSAVWSLPASPYAPLPHGAAYEHQVAQRIAS